MHLIFCKLRSFKQRDIGPEYPHGQFRCFYTRITTTSDHDTESDAKNFHSHESGPQPSEAEGKVHGCATNIWKRAVITLYIMDNQQYCNALQKVCHKDNQTRCIIRSNAIQLETKLTVEKISLGRVTKLNWRILRQLKATKLAVLQIRWSRIGDRYLYSSFPARSDCESRGPAQRNWKSHQLRTPRQLRCT